MSPNTDETHETNPTFSRLHFVRGAAGVAALPLLVPNSAAAALTRPRVSRAHIASTGLLRIGYNGATTDVLDPASSHRFYEAVFPIYSRLVRPNNQNRPSPDLAVSWSANSHANVWTFKLRNGVLFHNGSAFTSKDVAYTLAHVLDPKFGSPGLSVLGSLLDPDSVKTPSADTVVFKLKAPDADFPVLMMAQATFIIPDGSVGSIATSGIGTGPFKVDSFQPGSQTNLSAFSKYYRGQPALAGIQLLSIADAQARTSALLAGQVDLLWSQSLDFAAAKEIGANPNLVVQNAASGDWHLIVMRTDVAPFTDNRVRQAMKLVVDDKEMIKVVLQGYGQPAGNNPVAPDDPYRLRNTWKPNISKAKALLKEAGKSGLHVTLYTSSSDGIMIPMSVTYKAMAAKAGINVTVQPTPPDTYFDTIVYHKSLCTDDWAARPADQLLNELFRSGAKHNEFFWHNKQFDSLLNAARRELNFTRRRRLYQQAQQLVANESGAIIPFFQNRLRGMNKRVQNIPATVEDPDFFVVKLA